MSEDISSILKEWDEDPDSGRIRKIVGLDGDEKIQIRIQFGMLQMEADGRPDGKKPYGKESLLEHYISLLDTYKSEYGTDENFSLDNHDCDRLREESLQYYHRYISLFEIGDYERAERDTARNLRAIDLMKRYAERQDDALDFEKYKPYIIMMNARARAFIQMREENYPKALECVNEAIDSITNFYIEHEISDIQIEKSQEIEVLKSTAKEIRDKWES
jgi:tetratricopeptide (TPR) repeat protein